MTWSRRLAGCFILLLLGCRASSARDDAGTAPGSSARLDASTANVDARRALAEIQNKRLSVVAASDGAVVWRNRDQDLLDGTGRVLCPKCTSFDLVFTPDRIVWLDPLDVGVHGFDSGLRAIPRAGWVRKGGGSYEPGERIASFHHARQLVGDGKDVLYVVTDDGDGGVANAVVRFDTKSGKSSTVLSAAGPIGDLAPIDDALFFTWSETGKWHLARVPLAGGKLHAIAGLPFVALPDVAFAPTSAFLGTRRTALDANPVALDEIALSTGVRSSIHVADPGEVLGPMAADASGLYVARFVGRWVLTRFEHGGASTDLADLTEGPPGAIAPLPDGIAIAFATTLRVVAKVHPAE